MPTCWIFAGPNGAGKTTFALKYLPQVAHCALSNLLHAFSLAVDVCRRYMNNARVPTVIWKDGAPVKVGGEAEDMEVPFLLADKNFHEQQLLTRPESARLTRMSAVSRIKSIDERLAQLASAKRFPPHDAQ